MHMPVQIFQCPFTYSQSSLFPPISSNSKKSYRTCSTISTDKVSNSFKSPPTLVKNTCFCLKRSYSLWPSIYVYDSWNYGTCSHEHCIHCTTKCQDHLCPFLETSFGILDLEYLMGELACFTWTTFSQNIIIHRISHKLSHVVHLILLLLSNINCFKNLLGRDYSKVSPLEVQLVFLVWTNLPILVCQFH